MTITRYPFVHAASVFAPSLLLLLSATGIHAEVTTHEFTIVSAPPITGGVDGNEAKYTVSGDCAYIPGYGEKWTLTFSDRNPDSELAFDVDTTCGDTGEWSVTTDITNFGSGKVDAEGILKKDVEIQAIFTDDNGVYLEHSVSVHRNPDSSRAAPDLIIGLMENRTVVDDEFKGGARCGANKITMDNTGMITIHETDCARMVSATNADATVVMTDPLTGASGACEFETLTMNRAGHIQITVDPMAAIRCIDDKDFDGILDMQDPEPGTDVNNGFCVDSQNLIDNVALTNAEPICQAKDSITVQGVRLPEASDVCYEAGQFVRFAPPALVASVDPEPVFVVPSGTIFSIPGSGGIPCGS